MPTPSQEEWWSVYLDEGDNILKYGLGKRRIASQFGISVNASRRLLTFLARYGPPSSRKDPSPPNLSEQNESLYNPSKKLPKHLVIGDAHAGPGQDLRRFRWLAKFCLHHRPDVVVSIGDWFGLDSLCMHGSTADRETQRLLHDLEAGNEALRIFAEELQRHNLKNPSDLYCPRLVVTLGNHDARIIREAHSNPHLIGILDYDLMHWEQYGWEVVPFLQPCEIDGVTYSHYFTRPGSGRAISGKYHAAALVREGLGGSFVCGHSHKLDWHSSANIHGKRAQGLVAGCFFEHIEDYAKTSNNQWFRGLVLLNDVVDGDYDLEVWSMARIKRLVKCLISTP